MQFDVLLGQTLQAIHANVFAPHPAWIDSRHPQFWCGPVALVLGSDAIQVVPREVPINGQYPSLGIQISPLSEASSSADLEGAAAFLPARISDVRLWDSLGEGPVSAVDLVLDSGVTFTIRHVYPPMTLGIDIRPEGRHEP
jgi:hypothetical protein